MENHVADYLEVITDGSYLGRSIAGGHDIYRLNEDFYFVNRYSGEVLKILDDDVIYQHTMGKTLCATAK